MNGAWYYVEAYPGNFYVYKIGDPKPHVKGLRKAEAERLVEDLNTPET